MRNLPWEPACAECYSGDAHGFWGDKIKGIVLQQSPSHLVQASFALALRARVILPSARGNTPTAISAELPRKSISLASGVN